MVSFPFQKRPKYLYLSFKKFRKYAFVHALTKEFNKISPLDHFSNRNKLTNIGANRTTMFEA